MKSIRMSIAVMILSILAGCGTGISTGVGKKVGQIVQLGKHGMFCDTWEGKLIRGGFSNGSGANGGEFNFTVLDENLAHQLEEAMAAQSEVEIEYRQTTLSGLCTADSDHFILGFKIIKTAPKGAN